MMLGALEFLSMRVGEKANGVSPEEAIKIHEALLAECLAATGAEELERDDIFDRIMCNETIKQRADARLLFTRIVDARSRLAGCYEALGRSDDAIDLMVKCHSWTVTLNGAGHGKSILYAINVALAMHRAGRYVQARSFCRAPIEALANPNFERGLHLRLTAASVETALDAVKGVALLEVIVRDARRAIGDGSQIALLSKRVLDDASQGLERSQAGNK